MNEAITQDIEKIFNSNPTTKNAINTMIQKLIDDFETEGTITGYTFTSIVSEMGALSELVREASSSLYTNIEGIYTNKLIAEGYQKDRAKSIALMMTAAIEGAIMLSLTKQSSEPLKIISNELIH